MICAAMFLISALCAFYTAALNIELITFFMGGDSLQHEPSGEYRIESSARHSLHFFFALHDTFYLCLWLGSGGVNATSDDDHVPPLEV